MKKVFLSLLLVFCTMFSVSTNSFHVYASDSLSDAMKQECYDEGYPYIYRGHLQSFYDIFSDLAGGSPIWGDSTFGAFLEFISSVKEINSSTDDEVSAITRAMYLEVSNMSNRIESINGISDCLTNRLIANMSGNYMEAAQCLDGLNSAKSTTYWHSIMKNPIPDACGGGSDSKKGLVTAYLNSYLMNANEIGMYPYFHNNESPDDYSRYSSLPTGYLYFNESPGSGRIKIGSFYFRMTY